MPLERNWTIVLTILRKSFKSLLKTLHFNIINSLRPKPSSMVTFCGPGGWDFNMRIWGGVHNRGNEEGGGAHGKRTRGGGAQGRLRRQVHVSQKPERPGEFLDKKRLKSPGPCCLWGPSARIWLKFQAWNVCGRKAQLPEELCLVVMACMSIFLDPGLLGPRTVIQPLILASPVTRALKEHSKASWTNEWASYRGVGWTNAFFSNHLWTRSLCRWVVLLFLRLF